MVKGMARIMIVLALLFTAIGCGSGGVDDGLSTQSFGNQNRPPVNSPDSECKLNDQCI